MKLIKRLLWMIPLTIKWIFIFALLIVTILGIYSAVIAALKFLFSAPDIFFNGIVIVFVIIAIIWIAWWEAGEYV